MAPVVWEVVDSGAQGFGREEDVIRLHHSHCATCSPDELELESEVVHHAAEEVVVPRGSRATGRTDWDRLLSPVSAGVAGDAAGKPRGPRMQSHLSGIRLQSFDKACFALWELLWAEVLPVAQAGGTLQCFFRALASSSIFARLFVGPERGPFVFPKLQCIIGALSLQDIAQGLSAAKGLGMRNPCEIALTLTDGDRFKCPVGLPPVESIDELKELLGYGTIFLNAASMHWKPLARICLAASGALQFPMNINVYVTGQNRPVSTDVHTDNHDVLVLQTQGAKHWRVYAPPPLAPGKRALYRGKDEDKLRFEELGEPLLDLILLPGQVLFIPIGFPHATDTVGTECDEVSVHLTLGISAADWDFSYSGVRKDVLRRIGADCAMPPEAELGGGVFWGLHAPLPVGALLPRSVRSADSETAAKQMLAQIVGDELCRLLQTSEPGRFPEGDLKQLRPLAIEGAAMRLGLLVEALETQEAGYREVLDGQGDILALLPRDSSVSPYRRMMVKENVGVCRSGVGRMSPRRLDPGDGSIRSLSELHKIYGHEYSSQDIQEYWSTSCKSVFPGDQPPGDLMGEIEEASRSCAGFLKYLQRRMPHLHTSALQAKVASGPSAHRSGLADSSRQMLQPELSARAAAGYAWDLHQWDIAD